LDSRKTLLEKRFKSFLMLVLSSSNTSDKKVLIFHCFGLFLKKKVLIFLCFWRCMTEYKDGRLLKRVLTNF
jgi:hypothetical protein